MRIVNLKTFQAMPAGTVYMSFHPHVFGDLEVKGDTVEHDYYYCKLSEIEAKDSNAWADKLFAAVDDPSLSLPMDFACYCRDGSFDETALFAVLEKADLEGLIDKLQECLRVYE